MLAFRPVKQDFLQASSEVLIGGKASIFPLILDASCKKKKLFHNRRASDAYNWFHMLTEKQVVVRHKPLQKKVLEYFC